MLRSREFHWPLLAFVLLAAPLWLVATPGMPDYPAHLASFALIAGEPSRYYFVHWQALPNLASEIAVPLLARVMSLEMATRLFLTATVGLWVLGVALIQRSLFGRTGWSVLIAALFAYNANFVWGFFNYSFATGLALCLLAAWIATDGKRHAGHLAGFALAFTALYFCHLFALAVLLLAIGGYELSGWRDEQWTPAAAGRHVLEPAVLCIPAALAFLLLRPPGAQGGQFQFDLLDTLQDRFEAAIQFGFDTPVLPLTLGLIALFVWAVWTGRASVHPRIRIALALFAVTALFAPEWALGGWGVHMRLPGALGALAFASLEWRWPPRRERLVAAAALLLIVAGAGMLALDWRGYDRQFAEFRARESALVARGRVLTALDGDSLGWTADQPYWHMAEFAVIDRGVFTPLMFTTAGQHVVHIRAPFGRFAAATAQQGSPPDIDELDDLAHGRMEADDDYRDVFPYLDHFQCHFDQVIVIEGPGRHAAVPAVLHLRAAGSFYRLYDVASDPSCASR